MSNIRKSWKAFLLITVLVMGLCSSNVFAASNDNSLSSLGITTEGAVVSPEFYYSTVEYNVTVPAGTQTLELDPVTSNPNAWIVDITGKDLVDGKATVQIIVSAENGNQYSYYLYVTADASAGTAAEETEAAETEPEPETEPETEDPRYVKVDRNSLQEAESTISALKDEANNYRDRLGLMMKILYGMIAFCVVLLFTVINLILKKKDLKHELKNYMEMGGGYEAYDNSQGDYSENDDQASQEQYDQNGYQDSQGYYEQDDYGASSEPYEQSDYQDAQGYYEQDDYSTFQEPYDQDDYQKSQEQYEPYDDQMVPLSDESQMKFEPQQEAPEKDDPETVPKPAKARKRAKQMPEYQQPQKQERVVRKKKGKASDNVEVTMIDL